MEINQNKVRRLLCIVGGMNAGGAETFLMKVYRSLDKTKYQMDFYVTSLETGFYDEEILSMGGKIFRSIPKTKSLTKCFKSIMETVKRENYDYVMRVSQHSLSTIDLLAAKLGGAKTLVYRSSNSNTGGGILNQVLHILFKWLPMIIPTVKIAPSSEAAIFMFGKNCLEKGKVSIVKNGISVDDFLFDQRKRDKIRIEFELFDKLVIGNVGRFNNQKNHSFLIEVFDQIVKEHENSILFLVGKGELQIEIKNKIDAFGLMDKVIFTGVRSDVPDLMMAMDIFVFPSYFEGMPNTVIEAQATGLPCIISSTITKEAQITNLVEYMSLDDSSKQWAQTALKYKNEFSRLNMRNLFVEIGYDINSVTQEIQKLIFPSVKNNK